MVNDMQKFFYTDPLAAAWMWGRQDMKFVNSRDEPLAWRALTDDLYERYYVHPGSLHLLKAKPGDVLREPSDFARCVVVSHSLAKLYRREGLGSARIIQRDGKPFFWPESEAA